MNTKIPYSIERLELLDKKRSARLEFRLPPEALLVIEKISAARKKRKNFYTSKSDILLIALQELYMRGKDNW